MQYRPELDGLRAVAVLSVLLFHAGSEFFLGGFVGVDIFFVLSGYLITSIVLTEVRRGSFSLAGFYERRIRRLLPPLIPVLIFTAVLSSLLLNGLQFQAFVKSNLSALAMVSNWNFLFSTGYFDGPSETIPLLHTWSLSIEEQFYLLFPFLTILLFRYTPKYVMPVYLCLFSFSFALSAYLIFTNQLDTAFYASPGRFWELLVGVVLAGVGEIKLKTWSATALEVAGFGLVSVAIFGYSPATTFPGPSAILPTLGTAMVIAAGGRGQVVSPVLRNKWLVWVGLISYALYLWHWPLLALLKIVNPEPAPFMVIIVLVAALALSAASRYLIEKPFRNKAVFASRRSIFSLGIGFAVLAVFISVGALSPKMEKLRLAVASKISMQLFGVRAQAIKVIEKEQRFYMDNLSITFAGNSSPQDMTAISYPCSYDSENTPVRIVDCIKRQAGLENILVLGDSVGRDTWLALKAAFPDKNFVMLHQSGCPPGDEIHPEKKTPCFARVGKMLEEIDRNISIKSIVLSFRYRPVDWRTVEPTLVLAKNITGNVALFGVAPVYAQTISNYVRTLEPQAGISTRILKDNKSMVPWSYDEIAEQAKEMAGRNSVEFIDIRSFFCDSVSCTLWADDSLDKPIFWDEQHLTAIGIKRYGGFLSNMPPLQTFMQGTRR